MSAQLQFIFGYCSLFTASIGIALAKSVSFMKEIPLQLSFSWDLEWIIFTEMHKYINST